VSATTLCSSCQHLVIQKPFKKTINLAPVMLKSQYLMDRRDVNWAPLILLTAFHQKSEETTLFFPPCPRLWLLILPSKISFDGLCRQVTRNMGCCSTRFVVINTASDAQIPGAMMMRAHIAIGTLYWLQVIPRR
jgi:hypothetical protein